MDAANAVILHHPVCPCTDDDLPLRRRVSGVSSHSGTTTQRSLILITHPGSAYCADKGGNITGAMLYSSLSSNSTLRHGRAFTVITAAHNYYLKLNRAGIIDETLTIDQRQQCQEARVCTQTAAGRHVPAEDFSIYWPDWLRCINL